ncbi:MAG: hypothetical protein ACYTEU_05765 [Planctomycetota bacterium]|jgi:hypothetical protein
MFSKKQYDRWNTPAVQEKAKALLESVGFTNVGFYEEETYVGDGTAIDPMGQPCIIEMEAVYKKGWTTTENFPYNTVLYFSRYAKSPHTQSGALAKKPVYHLQLSQLNLNVGFLAEWATIRAFGVETYVPTDRGNEGNISLSVDLVEFVNC